MAVIFAAQNTMLLPAFRYWLLPIAASLIFLSSCHQGAGAPDVSGEKVELHTRRFDRDLAQIDTNRIADALHRLHSKYPDFLDFWLDDLMQFGINGNYADSSAGVRDHLRIFLTHHDFRGLFDTVAVHYPDTRSIDAPLREGFRYYHHYYPSKSIPGIVYFISGLNNWSAITIDTSLVGIGLDMFLGGDYPFYKSVGIPDYVARNCRPEAAPALAFRAIYENAHPFVAEGRTLLDLMVQRGKEQYFLSRIVPFLADSTRLGFTAAQTQWCSENEANVYNFFVRANMFYDTKLEHVLRYVNEGPESSGLPPQCPGNIGTWLGWQMVKAYAAKHPTMSMEELFAVSDAQTILQEGGYKPR